MLNYEINLYTYWYISGHGKNYVLIFSKTSKKIWKTFLQQEISQVTNPSSPPASVPNTSPSATSQSPVHNRTDEEKAAEAISDDITDEDKAVAEQREEVQKKVSARIFSG